MIHVMYHEIFGVLMVIVYVIINYHIGMEQYVFNVLMDLTIMEQIVFVHRIHIFI